MIYRVWFIDVLMKNDFQLNGDKRVFILISKWFRKKIFFKINSKRKRNRKTKEIFKPEIFASGRSKGTRTRSTALKQGFVRSSFKNQWFAWSQGIEEPSFKISHLLEKGNKREDWRIKLEERRSKYLLFFLEILKQDSVGVKL